MTFLSSLPFFALLRILVYDKNGEATSVCSLLLQKERNQRHINFSIVNEY